MDVLEALNQGEAARALYQEIINTCTSCRTPVDPQIKHRFAELSFALGHRDTTLLETYLSLALEMEPYRALYYDRVSRIYTDQGHTDQARRFQVLAQRAK